MIEYIVGDATRPQKCGDYNIIAHITNTNGAWGAGFVLALSSRFGKGPCESYKQSLMEMGEVSLWDNGEGIIVFNMNSMDYAVNYPVSEAGLRTCLEKLDTFCKEKKYKEYSPYTKTIVDSLEDEVVIHMPRIGTGLGRAKWSDIRKILEETIQPTFKIIVYDLPEQEHAG